MKDAKRIKAENRLKDLTKYYKHVIAYILVNLMLIFLSFTFTFKFLISFNFRMTNKFNDFENGVLPIWVVWGVILLADTARVFILPKFFSKDWEERKINQFLKEDN